MNDPSAPSFSVPWAGSDGKVHSSPPEAGGGVPGRVAARRGWPAPFAVAFRARFFQLFLLPLYLLVEFSETRLHILAQLFYFRRAFLQLFVGGLENFHLFEHLRLERRNLLARGIGFTNCGRVFVRLLGSHQISLGTFDSFNMVVAGVKGALAPGVVRIYDTLMASSLDEISTSGISRKSTRPRGL